MSGSRLTGSRPWGRPAAALALAAALLPLVACGGPDGPVEDGPEEGPVEEGPEEARSVEGVVLVVLDTVRRDHLSLYGYRRDTSPRLARLAARGMVYEEVYSQQTNTGPSHATLFTGLYPHQHGCLANGRVLPEEATTLAEILRSEGLTTAAFVSGYVMNAELSGLDQGFELYDDEFDGWRRSGVATVERARRWLAERAAGERFFLFVHLYDAHGPYHPDPAYERLFAASGEGPRLERIPEYQVLRDASGQVIDRLGVYVSRYDACIRMLDDLVGELAGALDLSRTALVVTSDHGETLGERWWPLDHGGRLFEEQLAVPLLVLAPGRPPGRDRKVSELRDLFPTLLELAGVSGGPPPMAGAASAQRPRSGPSPGLAPRSLLRPGDGAAAPGPRPVFASVRAVAERYPGPRGRRHGRRLVHSVRTAAWKLIRYPTAGGPTVDLHRLHGDPASRPDVAEQHPAVREELLRTLELWGGIGVELPKGPRPAPEVVDNLRALGYLAEE